jgi:hypothetical protein
MRQSVWRIKSWPYMVAARNAVSNFAWAAVVLGGRSTRAGEWSIVATSVINQKTKKTHMIHLHPHTIQRG